MADEKLGIDLLEDLLEDGVALFNKIAEAKADDDKISKVELIGMLPKAAAIGKDLLNYKGLLEQAKDVDSEEGRRLVSKLINLGVLGNKAEIVLINIVELVEGEILLYENNVVPIINVFKKEK